jgi:hypothetical protein
VASQQLEVDVGEAGGLPGLLVPARRGGVAAGQPPGRLEVGHHAALEFFQQVEEILLIGGQAAGAAEHLVIS